MLQSYPVAKLLLRLLVLAVAGALGTALLLPVVLRGGVDAFYGRFASPAAGSLILGTSRAAQGIRPAVLAARLGGQFEGPLLNYAFTLTHSPYGPAYLASIRRKLRPEVRHGLFLVAVDPWSLSANGPTGAAEADVFPEAQSFIGQLHEVSQSPNLAYLAHYQTKPLYRLPLDFATATERLHPDGWLEVNIGLDSAQVRARTARKLLDYRRLAATQHLAAGRLIALRQTVEFLQAHGRVVLVRLPVGPGLRALEQQYQPGFEAKMRRLAADFAVAYLDYSAAPYATTDGNHLQKAASETFSQQLADDLRR
ncbi:hypothetical protein [Hymenobacter sp. UYCo722]|uniref:hypothetical protein n=1 Tax=Hymenobacter sp. UYCo722 TaxID=3156335 RepID=UPI003392034D